MSKYDELLENTSGLRAVLSVADANDLGILVDYITDKGDGRLALDSDVTKRLHNCKQNGVFTTKERRTIEEELLLFGGNSIANALRGIFGSSSSITYSELVRDVADKVGAANSSGDSNMEVESAIVLKLFQGFFNGMSEAEQAEMLKAFKVKSVSELKSFGHAAAAGATASAATMLGLKMSGIVAGAIATNLLGGAVGTAITLTGGRAVAALMGPIGVGIAAAWSLSDMASPAFRVTMPCVVHIAHMRQKYLNEAQKEAA